MASGELRRAVEALVREWAAGRLVAPVSPSATQQWVDGQLRQHETRGLRPHPRGRLYGGRIRTIRPGRPITGAESPVSTDILRIEPGLLAFSGDPSLPLSVYTSDDLAAWMAGSGWEIPDSDGARTWFVGRLETQDGSPRWPDEPPLQDLGADSYTSQLYASLATLSVVLGAQPPAARLAVRPHEYTGPARMLAEACLAAGRRFSDRLPVGCSKTPGRVQILWSGGATGARRPWALDISDAGLIAHPLIVSERTRTVLDWIEDGLVTGISRHLAWLYVLADLAPDPDPEAEPVVVLSAAGIADAYADGGPGPAMSGWIAPPYTGEPGLEMSCVLGGIAGEGTAERYVTRLCTVTVSATGSSAPTASLSQVDQGEFRPAGETLLYVGDPETSAPLQCATTTQTGDDSAPVACVYTQAGDLERLRYWSSISYDAADDDDSGSGGCGEGGYRESAGSLSQVSVGYGWTRPPYRLVGDGSVSVGTGSWESEQWTEWPGGGYGWGLYDYNQWGCSTTCGSGHWYPYTREFPPIECYSYYGSLKFQVRTLGATAVGRLSTYSLTGSALRQIGVYWPTAPDAVWLSSASIASTRTSRVETRKFGSWKGQEWRARERWVDCQGGEHDDIGPVHAGWRLTSWATFWDAEYYLSGTVDTPTVPLTWDGTAELRIGGQSIAAGDWGDWDSWWPAPEPAASIGVQAIVAARGPALWIPHPGADWERAGIGDACPANLTQGWAGA